MSVGAFIVARLSSTRLPRKALMDILGKPMIERLIERVRRARSIDKVVIATSRDPSDDPLEALAAGIGLACHRGSLPDIRERLRAAAEAHGCETIVEILGDNPLVHGELVEEVVGLYQKGGYDYCASVTREYPEARSPRSLFALGIRVQVYSLDAARRHKDYPGYLEAADKGSTAYIYEQPRAFRLGFLEAKGRWASLSRPDLNFAVNYRKNFEMVSRIFERLHPQDPDFSLQKVIELYDRDKELRALMGA